MKITKQALKRIIKEETRRLISEIGPPPDMGDPDWHPNMSQEWEREAEAEERAEYGDETGGENEVYVLDRGRFGEERIVVGVYSSRELAQKGIESDIEAWRASGRMAQPPKPGEYDIQDFELDD
jgi:hypothetical protein